MEVKPGVTHYYTKYLKKKPHDNFITFKLHSTYKITNGKNKTKKKINAFNRKIQQQWTYLSKIQFNVREKLKTV